MPRRSVMFTVGAAAAVAAAAVFQPPVRPAAPRAAVDRAVRAFDEPAAAAAYYAARRAAASPGIDPQERYRTALDRIVRMPRFATATGRRLPPLRESGMASSPLSWPTTGRPASRDSAFVDAWIPLGPGNIGGRTRTLQLDPRNPNRMYAGGVSGGVWKTEDAGASWRPVGDRLANLAVNAMAISPRDPGAIYVGTGEGYFREDVRYTGLPLRGAGVFASRDGGESWAQLPATAGPDFHFVNDLLVSQQDDRVLYAATRTGVWRSRDRGASWEQLLPVSVRGGCLDLALRSDRPSETLFASCGTFEQATVYRTLDARGAAAFTPVLSDPGMGRTTLAIAPGDPDVVYALAASNLPGPNGLYEQALHAVFRSGAGGAPGTWTAQVRNTDPVKLRTLILTNPIAASYSDCRFASVNSYTPMGWYASALAVDPADSNTVWAAGVDWFRSRDGGRTWGLVSEWWRLGAKAYAHADQHGLVFHPGYNGTTNQQAFALTDGGIYRTDNARAADSTDPCSPSSIQVSWTPLNHNFGVTQFYHGLPFPDGAGVIGGTQDNGTIAGADARGIDGWTEVFGGDGGYVAFDPSNPAVVYLETQWGAIVRSENGGRTFADASDGLDPADSDDLVGSRANFLFVTPFVADNARKGTLWTGGRYIYRRVNAFGPDDPPGLDAATWPVADERLLPGRQPRAGRASTWRRASDRLLGDALVSAVTAAASDPNRVAAGATDGRVHVTANAQASEDAVRWDATQPRSGWVTSVAFDPGNADILYATYGGFGGAHVFKSVNGGRTWRAVDGTGDSGVPDVPAHAVAVDPGRSGRVYLATDVGVFVSDTGGDVWAVENTGFGAIVTEWLSPLRLANGERWLFAFTHGRGAWKVRLG